MTIGIDFDNTIVCYDHIIHQVACQRGLIPRSVPARKEPIRDYLRRLGREDDWTELQGYIYGPGIKEARPFPGVVDFFKTCRTRLISLYIISHKTQRPFKGPAYNLHAAAQGWLKQNGFYDSAQIGISEDRVFFEKTKSGKLNRIAELNCDYFIDDLPEFLSEPAFPQITARILFDPWSRIFPAAVFRRVASWREIADVVLAQSRDGTVDMAL